MRGFCLDVRGPYACFTRPEMKVERVSYDVITPSAARSVFDAVLWKPAMRWRITKIEVLAPIRWASVRRNEVGKVASERVIFIEDERQQRASLILRDVRYRLHAYFDYILPEKRGNVFNPVPEWLHDQEEVQEFKADESEAKYAAMFERRAKKGQCFTQPYLGCREFASDFRLVVQSNDNEPEPINESRDLGWMLYDLDYSNGDAPQPMFFRARMDKGVVTVPDLNSEEVRR
ncbi:MAG: type I-C CRISPR-associated protein Cas5c [bacterium]|nr:type I-C CRISPR-associated protein Cas5c [Candidatus Sumerlaeota bacterium]